MPPSVVIPPTADEQAAHAAHAARDADRAALPGHAAAAAAANSVPELRAQVADITYITINHDERIRALEARISELMRRAV